ncbi:hypothetical protein Leryth_027020 [Lithospermum erythrorhizon]|nr:hypothetical protein Leryth_027020 [Lithospermum erythrorhizon]
MKNNESLCKAVLIYIIGCLFCPEKNDGMTLKYARFVRNLGEVSKYNWSQLILEYLQKATRGYKAPKADIHFFLIHYLERMGLNSPFDCAQYRSQKLGC